MRIIPFTFPAEWENIELYPLGDIHIGDPKTDIKLFQNFVKYIKEKENRIVVCVGDLLNNALKSSVSNVYNETMNPNEQRKWLAVELQPIKDRILCMVSGNHEYRTKKEADLDPIEWLSEKLGIKYYSEDELAIKISFGEGYNQKPITYTFMLTHGAGGGKRPGSVINNLELYAMTLDGADVVIVGHSHRRFGYKFSPRVFDPRNNIVKQVDRLCVVSSSWQDFGGYAARKMLIPGTKGAEPIILNGRVKSAKAVI
jgi:predicted phosphodiesterase